MDNWYFWHHISVKSNFVPVLLGVSFFLNSVTKLWDTVSHLCMCKGHTHHGKVSESQSGCEKTNIFNFCLPITVKWECNDFNCDETYRPHLSEWCQTSHRKSGQCLVGICPNADRHAAFIYSFHCMTLRADLVHMVEIFEIAYGMWWQSKRRSPMRKGDKVELNFWNLVKWSRCQKLQAENGAM